MGTASAIIISIASVITALGVILGVILSVHKWYLKQEKQDDDIKVIKEEQSILTQGVLACLKGLKEQGCDGPVTLAIEKIESHINKGGKNERHFNQYHLGGSDYGVATAYYLGGNEAHSVYRLKG